MLGGCLLLAGLMTGGVGGLTAVDAGWQAFEDGRWHAVEPAGAGSTGFTRMPAGTTGLRFTNVLDEPSGAANRVLYNGAGVAAGDVDGDGLPEVFLCDLGGTNRLFRNLGGWRFEDATAASGLGTPQRGSRGAVLADINGDGALDLLVSVNGRGVLCFLNDGRGRFRDATEAAGTAAPAGSTTLALADVNADGHLDLYVANYRTDDIRDRGSVRIRMVQGRPVMAGGESNRFSMVNGRLEENGQPDRLLLNDGTGRFNPASWTDGTFLDESGKPLREAPLDWGLAAAFRDINGDLAPDLYVCNDYWTPDRMWINDGTGRFRAVERHALRHLSASSMSVDFSDVDRDGHLDFFVVDMLSRTPALRKRQKFAQEAAAVALAAAGERPQLPHNTLFLNRGDGTFAEVAHAAGVHATDWSWAPLFLDVDLDGFEDLLVGAGHFRDVQDFDAEAQIQARQHSWDRIADPVARQRAFTQELMEHYRLYPLLQMPIGAFRNRRDATFEEVTDAWRLDLPGVHQGLVSADLDQDGDLDLVVNSLNGPAMLLRNDAAAPRVGVRVRGRPPNAQAVGAQVTLRVPGWPPQRAEVVSGGRYLSGCDPQLSFACGSLRNDLSLEVVWRDGLSLVVSNLTANRLYEIGPDRARPRVVHSPPPVDPLFEELRLPVDAPVPPADSGEFSRQPLLPYALSNLGPGLSLGDLNGDHHADLVAGSARGGVPRVLLGDGRGGWRPVPPDPGLALPDATGGLLSGVPGGGSRLLAALTGYEEARVPAVLSLGVQAGSLQLEGPAVAQPAPGGALALGDPRGTGPRALFVAGGVQPGRYPLGAASRLFWSEGQRWVPDNASAEAFASVGLVNAALWVDLDGDGLSELVLACEWGPLRVFRLQDGRWRELTEAWGLSGLTGLWRGVSAGDFDGDGRMDLVASNWGGNSPWRASTERPLILAHGFLTQSNVLDVIETEWVGDQLAPRRQSLVLAGALPQLAERFPDRRSLSEAGLDAVLGDRSAAIRRERATTLASMVFLNTGAGFRATPLPPEAQWAPAFGVSVADFDGDGAADVFLAQNLSGVGSELPRMDAGSGLVLRGDGRGGFSAMPPAHAGVRLLGEQRGSAVGDVDGDGRTDLAVGSVGTGPSLFRNRGSPAGLRVRLQGRPENPEALGAILRRIGEAPQGGATLLAAGGGHWSQDSPVVVLHPRAAIRGVWIRWPGGRTTTTEIPPTATEVVIDPEGSLRSVR